MNITFASRTVNQPADLPAIQTVGLPKVIRASVTDLEAEMYGAKPGASSESKSWTFSPDPWEIYKLADGTQVLRIQNMHLTVVRYDIAIYPYKACYVTLRADWVPMGWRSVYINNDINKEIDITLEITDSGGGTVATTGWRKFIPCTLDAFAVVSQKDLRPEIYDIISGGKFQTPPVTYWLKCS